MNPDDVRELADEIVARPEFDLPEPTVQERATDWVERFVADLLSSVFGGGGGTVVGLLVLAGLVALVVWLAVRAGRTVQADRRVPGVTVDEVHRRSPDAWRAEATRAEADGRWKDALLSRYRALVGDLVAEDLLVDVAGRTTGELRADLRAAAPDRAEAFDGATELFELAWYADRPTGPDESARFQELAAAATGVRV